MNLEGANNFSDNNNFTIFTMNSSQTGQYCVVVPKNTDNKINMLVDLNMKNSFDSLANNAIDKDTLVKDIEAEYNNVLNKYPSCVLVFPMLDINELNASISSNDKQKMFDETKKIGSITSELYQKLSNGGIDKSKIDQKIIIVEKAETDEKFVSWLKEQDQMSDFVDGFKYEESSNDKDVNVNPFTGEVSSESTSAPEPKPEAVPVDDIFGPAASETPIANPSSEDKVEESNAPVNEVSVTEAVPGDTVESEPAEPTPVTEKKLETTQAIPAVEESNTPALDNTSEQGSTSEAGEVHEIDKKSGGFANLLILLVILVGVTFASIELGKFLYNTFGA